jgi:GNAT superfamily N-acetyltransferase
VSLLSLAEKRARRTEWDEGYALDPRRLHPRQFGQLAFERRFLSKGDLPVGAEEAFKGSKSRFGRNDFATVLSVNTVFVAEAYKRKGYGLAMYLKALEYVSSRGYWLTNDTRRSTTGEAASTWQALFRYAQKKIHGPPPPERLFDYEKQEWGTGYYEFASDYSQKLVTAHRPVFAAYALNGAGRAMLEKLCGQVAPGAIESTKDAVLRVKVKKLIRGKT